MKEFWRRHEWPLGERRLHWLVTFDGDAAVLGCHAAHLPLLNEYRRLVDVVPPEWLHMTLESLCPPTAATPEELDRLLVEARRALSHLSSPIVQLGPARIDGGAVTWAVYPVAPIARVQEEIVGASHGVLGPDRVTPRRGPWWPHVTLGYGAADDPADDLAGALARAPLPRVDVTISEVALVDEEQDLRRREYRWRELGRVPVGAASSTD